MILRSENLDLLLRNCSYRAPPHERCHFFEVILDLVENRQSENPKLRKCARRWFVYFPLSVAPSNGFSFEVFPKELSVSIIPKQIWNLTQLPKHCESKWFPREAPKILISRHKICLSESLSNNNYQPKTPRPNLQVPGSIGPTPEKDKPLNDEPAGPIDPQPFFVGLPVTLLHMWYGWDAGNIAAPSQTELAPEVLPAPATETSCSGECSCGHLPESINTCAAAIWNAFVML